jgi:hypothetical protein
MTDQSRDPATSDAGQFVARPEYHRAAETRTVSGAFAELARMQGKGDTTPEHAQEDQRVTAQGVQEPYEQH